MVVETCDPDRLIFSLGGIVRNRTSCSVNIARIRSTSSSGAFGRGIWRGNTAASEGSSWKHAVSSAKQESRGIWTSAETTNTNWSSGRTFSTPMLSALPHDHSSSEICTVLSAIPWASSIVPSCEQLSTTRMERSTPFCWRRSDTNWERSLLASRVRITAVIFNASSFGGIPKSLVYSHHNASSPSRRLITAFFVS